MVNVRTWSNADFTQVFCWNKDFTWVYEYEGRQLIRYTMRDWLPFRQFPLRIASVERSIAIPSLLKWAMDDMTLEIWVASTEGESTISLFLPEQSGHRGSGLPSESPEATSSFDVVLTHKIRRVSLEYFTLSRSLGCLDWNWSSVPEYCRDSSWEVGLKTKKKFSRQPPNCVVTRYWCDRHLEFQYQNG